MQKEFKIFIAGIAVVFMLMILIGGVYFAFFAPGPKSTNSKPIAAVDGTSIQVRDFQPDVQTTTESSQVITDTEQFDLVYFPAEQAFLISLESKPLAAARTAGQQSLLQHLNIIESEACKLNIEVKVPDDIDNSLSGRNLGLSFCENPEILQ